jgi:hypothetical protein
MDEQREEFEVWREIVLTEASTAILWECWMVATLAERERAAKVCDRLSEGAWLAAQIRKG